MGSETKYKNPWLSIQEDQVRTPKGEAGIYGIINLANGVSTLAVDDGGMAYLIKEFKYAMGEYTIEIISGGITEGEDRITAVRRELKEEAGLEAGNIEELGMVHPYTTMMSATNHYYLARDLKLGESHPDDTETLEVLKVPYTQALEWVYDGTITHAASAMAILHAKDILLK